MVGSSRTIYTAPRDTRANRSQVEITTDKEGTTTMLLIKRTDCPISTRGRSNTTPQVAIRVNGQISLNMAVQKLIGDGYKYVVPEIEADSRKFNLRLLKAVPAKLKETDLFALGTGKKSKSVYANFGPVFNHSSVTYDYKASGNQVFDAEVNAEKGTISFTLPSGALTAPPVKHREKKTKTNGSTATVAAPTQAKLSVEDLQSLD